MNCPHHHKLFAAVPRSYRDLPLRLAEYGTCYRYEQSGRTLRPHARALAADERRAHLLHRGAVRRGVQRRERDVSEVFQDLRDREIRHALLAPTIRRKLGQKFVDEPELWKKTEEMVRGVLQRSRDQLRRSAERSRLLRPEDRRAGLERHRPRIHHRDQPGRFRRARQASASSTRPATTPKQDAALHPSRAARHARAFHRLPHRTLRRQLPALARAGAGPRPADRRRSAARSNTPAPSKPNCAPTKSAPSSTPAATTSKPRSPAPSR